LSSTEVVRALANMEDRPWPDYHNGNPITGRGIAKLLAPFGIRPTQISIAGRHRPNGYVASRFDEVFDRYIPRNQRETCSTIGPPKP
jgi:hypothetical protein